jgi:UDP-N-acetylglucosamine/UDP-N-acetylgalactosamine diphosphorylase
MPPVPPELRESLHQHGQDHVLASFDAIPEAQQQALLDALQSLDLAELKNLYAHREDKFQLPARETVAALPRPNCDQRQQQEYRGLAESAFRNGQVAYLVVAGGQGTRLGFTQPKGMFPIGPVSNKTLFQFHAEKILALRQRYGAAIPLLVMTSPATDAETRRFFDEQRCFGLPADDVWFFRQGTMPALDLQTGKVLMEAPGRLALSPNGHGGTLAGLADSGLLARLRDQGVETIYYFQVDNPLTNLADHVFLGQHLAQNAEASSKVLPKRDPLEKVGNFAIVDGRCSMIEYSDLPKDWALETDADGQLLFWAGNPAIHLFDTRFLQRLASVAQSLPWHVAKKKVPYCNDQSETVTPEKENAVKFERFIFDVLPLAERWTVLATAREDEFAPVKNAEGNDSPETAKQALSDLGKRWLGQHGVEVDPSPDVLVEISPLFALDASDLSGKLTGTTKVDRSLHLS